MDLKKFQIICSSVFLILVLMHQGNADEHFPFMAHVSKESVNVRAGANTNFEKIDKLTKDAKVIVLDKSFEWYKIQLPATSKAYLRSDYLKLKEADIFEVTGDRVNVRALPKSESSSLGQLKAGILVKVVSSEGGWSQLQSPLGGFAWIHQDFLTKDEEQVTSEMLTKPLEIPVVVLQPKVVEAPVLNLKGKLEQVISSNSSMVNYRLLIDGKPAYVLPSVPVLSKFSNMMVDVEGQVLGQMQNNSSVPLLHLRRISLVL